MPEFARVGDFCPNQACADDGKLQGEHQRNVVTYGKTKAGRQRYLCRRCGGTLTETKGTIFYRRRPPEAAMTEALAFLAEGSRISRVARVKGRKAAPILDRLRAAAAHAEVMEEELLRRYRMVRGYLGSLWAYVGHRGKKGDPETDERGACWRAPIPDRKPAFVWHVG